MDEVTAAVIVDNDESRLLDRYERLSFEVQLNQAILGRSLSEPSRRRRSRRTTRLAASLPLPASDSDLVVMKKQEETPRPRPRPNDNSKNRFGKVVKMLMRPILAIGIGTTKKDDPHPDVNVKHNKKLWKAFSRSLRV
ncbi:hypothetical protein ACH5RR_005122 [Cinchona calisaya]|uniref:Uncharacterized protein n=1 Tax=Cinchona calisaya TaxID=153742 RepID=A0ABD3AK97_9GENT